MINGSEEKNKEKAARLLEGAYAVVTPSDSVSYYKEFAGIYDDQFAQQLGYVYPHMLAEVYSDSALQTDNPILDVGCGTGLVAQALADAGKGHLDIDGLDISADMLKNAAKKNLYRSLYEADLTLGTEALRGDYGAIVSAGTFTFGHLGPQVLPELLSLGKAGTLHCIGVNSVYYEEQGFMATLETMVGQNLITQPETLVKNIYASEQPGNNEHINDTATVLVYRQN